MVSWSRSVLRGPLELSQSTEMLMELIHLQNSPGLSRVDELAGKKPHWAGLQADLS